MRSRELIQTFLVITSALFGCATTSSQDCVNPPTAAGTAADAEPSTADSAESTSASPPASSTCKGDPTPPAKFDANLDQSDDPTLLAAAIGKPNDGMLCRGQVYTVTESFTIYRAWNSTNPGSEFGKWWAFEEPAGSVAQYRNDYEICYQWSPLDMMTRCTIKAGTKIVVGTGQSARCSEFLTYPTSASLQVYLEGAEGATESCQTVTANFAWRD